MEDGETPIALEAYEMIAERYSQLAETKAENGYIERPAMLRQLGDVGGQKILDAGCGPGILSMKLADAGATVVGFDISPKMIEQARARTGERVTFFVADMSRQLAFSEPGSFDIVASSLAIDYVRNWDVPLQEFWKALKPGGRLVFTVQHPLGAYRWYNPPSAFGVHKVQAAWRGFGGEPVMMPDYYRSFEEMINPLVKAGFVVKHIRDARPIEELREKDPVHYEEYSVFATFMCIEAVKP